MAKSPRSRVTRQQAKLARERVKDPDASLSELAQRSGYSDKAHVQRALNRPQVRERVRDLLEASPKLQLPSLLKKLEEGLDATETKFFQKDGVVVTEKVCVDYPTRLDYAKTALELHGVRDVEKGDSAPAIIGVLLEALDSARADAALARTAIPAQATRNP